MPTPLVFIHGVCCTPGVWERMANELEGRGFSCHAPALPLHHPDAPAEALASLGLRDYCESLIHDIKQLNLDEPPVLVGHSLGGLLAQMLATRVDPQALVLICPESPAGLFTGDRNKLLSFTGLLTRPGWWAKPYRFDYAVARAHLLNNLSERRARALFADLVQESGRVLFEAGCWALDSARASAVDPAAIRCPTLLVGAGMDRIISADLVAALSRHYAGSAYIEYPYNAHWLIDEDGTEELIQDMTRWLRSPEREQHRPQVARTEATPRGFTPRGLLASLSSSLSSLLGREVEQRLSRMGEAERALLEHGLAGDDQRLLWGLLARVPLFESLKGEQLAVLAGLLTQREVAEGERLVTRGEISDTMYFVVQGSLALELTEGTLPLGPGDYFGEIALLLGGARTATVRATSPCTVLVLSQAQFALMERCCPEAGRQIREQARARLARRGAAER